MFPNKLEIAPLIARRNRARVNDRGAFYIEVKINLYLDFNCI
jgi:hypothetical protein